MPILNRVIDEKGVETSFHRVLSYMVDVDTKKVLVCVGSYTNESVYNQEVQNRKKADRWAEVSRLLEELAEKIDHATTKEEKDILEKEYKELASEITGSVSRRVLAYKISEVWIDELENPNIETVERALLTQVFNNN